MLHLLGAPLSEFELTPMEELGNSIRQWILKKSLEDSSNNNPSLKSPTQQNDGDDLYDF